MPQCSEGMPARSEMEFSQVVRGCPGVQTRERGHDEVLEDGSSQSRSPVQALLERHMASRQSLAARIWANGVGKGGQGEWPFSSTPCFQCFHSKCTGGTAPAWPQLQLEAHFLQSPPLRHLPAATSNSIQYLRAQRVSQQSMLVVLAVGVRFLIVQTSHIGCRETAGAAAAAEA